MVCPQRDLGAELGCAVCGSCWASRKRPLSLLVARRPPVVNGGTNHAEYHETQFLMNNKGASRVLEVAATWATSVE